MNRQKQALDALVKLLAHLPRRQANTLAQLVLTVMHLARFTLPELGQRLPGVTAKSGTKRVWRFIANDRVEPALVMQGVIAHIVRRHRKKPLILTLDWTQVRKHHVLMLAAVMRGRAVPLLWAVYDEKTLHRSQNSLEEALLRLFRTMVPRQVRVILLADRGFGRTELARLCQELGFHYVIRIAAGVWIRHGKFEGRLSQYPVRPGMRRLLRGVQYRKVRSLVQNVVVVWRKDKREPWFLMTDLERGADQLCDLYGKRMQIEELFRDHKNRRNGFALRDTRIRSAENLSRALLILALGYILLLGIGLHAKEHYSPSSWGSSTRADDYSLFLIGQRMLDRVQLQIMTMLRAVCQAILEECEKWDSCTPQIAGRGRKKTVRWKPSPLRLSARESRLPEILPKNKPTWFSKNLPPHEQR